VGKSGASFLTQAMLLTLGSIPAALPVIFAAYSGICMLWLRSVFELKQDMDDMEQHAELAKPPQPEAERVPAGEQA